MKNGSVGTDSRAVSTSVWKLGGVDVRAASKHPCHSPKSEFTALPFSVQGSHLRRQPLLSVAALIPHSSPNVAGCVHP